MWHRNEKFRDRPAPQLGPQPCRCGLTIVEIVIALAIITIVFVAVLPQFRVMLKGWDTRQAGTEVIQNGRILADHISRNLSKAVKINNVSESTETEGFIEFQDNDGNNWRYDVNNNSNYVEFGPIGVLSDLAGPVSQLQFTCYDACDLDTPLDPITDASLIRCVKVEATLTNSAASGQDKNFNIQAYLRTNSEGLVSWWKFDEDSGSIAYDSSGSYNGTIYGNTTRRTGSPYGNSGYLDLDGTDDYVYINYISEGDFMLPRYTVAMLFRVDGGSDYRDLFSTPNTSEEHGLLLELRNTGDLRYLHRHPFDDWGGKNIYTPTTYDDGQWHHVAAVRDSDSSMLLYIDGEMVGSNTNATAFDEPVRVMLGTLRPHWLTRFWNGAIDDVRIYDRALSEEEINALCWQIRGLVGWWKFDETSGLTAADGSGSGNNGTLINMAGDEWTTGQINGALAFDGNDAGVDCNDNPSLNLDIGSWGAWVKLNAPKQWAARVIFKERSSTSGTGIYELFDWNGFKAEVVVEGVRYRASSPSSTNTGQWYHLFATYDGETLKLYVDGEEVASNTGPSGNITDNTGPLGVGTRVTDATFAPLFGTIDDVRVYNRVLSEEEVEELYNGGGELSGVIKIYP